MSAFPAGLEPSERSRIRPDAGLRTYRTPGGLIRGRKAYAETLYDLTLVYEYLTGAEADSVQAHFDADPDGDHTVGVDGDTYDVKYQNAPEVTGYHGTHRTVTVRFQGTKQ
jgi:hypothetical protein